MIKLSPKEVEFLKRHSADFKNGKIATIIDDVDSFGDRDKLDGLLKQMNISFSPQVVNKKISFNSIYLPSPEVFEEDDVSSYLYNNLSNNDKSAWTYEVHNGEFIQVANFYPGRASFGGNFPYNIKTQVLPIVEVSGLNYPRFTKLLIGDETWFVLDDTHIMYLGPTKLIKFDENKELDYDKSTIKVYLQNWLVLLNEYNEIKVIE